MVYKIEKELAPPYLTSILQNDTSKHNCKARSSAHWNDLSVFKSTSIRNNLLMMNTSLKRMIRNKIIKGLHKRKDWDDYNKNKKETLKSKRKARSYEMELH